MGFIEISDTPRVPQAVGLIQPEAFLSQVEKGEEEVKSENQGQYYKLRPGPAFLGSICLGGFLFMILLGHFRLLLKHEKQLKAFEKQMTHELDKHNKRIARLNRVRELAVQKNNTKLSEKVDELLKKEQNRYDRKHQRIQEKLEKAKQLSRKVKQGEKKEKNKEKDKAEEKKAEKD